MAEEEKVVRHNADGTTTTTTSTTRYDGDTVRPAGYVDNTATTRPAYAGDTVVERRRGGNPLLWIIVAALAIAAVTYALGLWRIGASGALKAPSVSVSGGEVPKVAVDTGKIVAGTKKETIDVPVIGVEKADKETAKAKAENK